MVSQGEGVMDSLSQFRRASLVAEDRYNRVWRQSSNLLISQRPLELMECMEFIP